MHTDEQIQKLIKAALKYAALPDGKVNHSDYLRLCKCVEPFREQRPRVGLLSGLNIVPRENIIAIELTQEVCTRLRPTAGVSRLKVQNTIADGQGLSTTTDLIMTLIADAGIEWEETT